MSELKYYKVFHRTSALTGPEFISVVEFGTNDEVYIKSEADKVIAELEESHKKEVEQLLMEIVKRDKVIAELKDKCQMHDFFWEGCGFAKRGFKNTIAVSEAYDRLEEENKELKEAQRWRKFPDEKPEEWETVIVKFSDGFYDLAVYLSNGQGWDIGDGLYHKSEEVTHWMPLPEPPEVSK